MPRVFVVGAYIPNGGTLMAYHLGRILATCFDFEPIAVQVRDESHASSLFRYPDEFPQISLDELRRVASSSDVAIVNPSFSNHLLGLGLPCRKVCYAQHFNTYQVLDGFFDLYVSVSRHVAQFLKQTYRLRTPVIPPFIEQSGYGAVTEWEQRERRVFVLPKGGALLAPLVAEFRARYEQRFGALDDKIEFLKGRLAHADLLQHLGRYRYCLSLSPCEGFGLLPLEAMRAGCTVVGLDGIGGRDYFRDGRNAAVTHYPDIDGLVQRAQRVLTDDRYAHKLAARGLATAQHYSIDRFYQTWTRLFKRFIPRTTS